MRMLAARNLSLAPSSNPAFLIMNRKKINTSHFP